MNPVLVGGIAGGLGVLVFALLSPRRNCPGCATPLPRIRKPTTAKQMLLGGWTCPSCGIEIDRKARKRE